MPSINMEATTGWEPFSRVKSPKRQVIQGARGCAWRTLVYSRRDDANNDVVETEEDNNVLAIPFMVDVDTPEADLSDLAIESISP